MWRLETAGRGEYGIEREGAGKCWLLIGASLLAQQARRHEGMRTWTSSVRVGYLSATKMMYEKLGT